jgi:hypothetical protein
MTPAKSSESFDLVGTRATRRPCHPHGQIDAVAMAQLLGIADGAIATAPPPLVGSSSHVTRLIFRLSSGRFSLLHVLRSSP